MIHISDEITLLIHLLKQTEKSRAVANQNRTGFASFLPLVE